MSYTPKLISRRVNAPCYGCKSRILGCHAQCEAYREYKAQIQQRKRAMREAYIPERDADEYDITQRIKTIKRRGGRI